MNLTVDEVQKMKVVELRAELTARGLDNRGVKAVLTDRLLAALQSASNVEGGLEGGQIQANLGNGSSISTAAPVVATPFPPVVQDQILPNIAPSSTAVGLEEPKPVAVAAAISPVRSTPRNQTPPRSSPNVVEQKLPSSPTKTVQQGSPIKLVSTPVPSPVKAAVVIPTVVSCSPVANSEVGSVVVTAAVTSMPTKSPTNTSTTAESTPPSSSTAISSPGGSPNKVQGIVESSSTSEQPESSQNQDSSNKNEQVEAVTTSAAAVEETTTKGENEVESMDTDKDGETNKRKIDDVNGDVEENKQREQKRVKTEPEQKILPENEPEFDGETVLLDWYMSDLNLKISTENFLEAEPFLSEDFPFAYAGSKATYGFTSGKLYYEVKWVDNIEVKQDLGDGENKHVLRFGWSDLEAGLQLGADKHSYGWDSSGKIFKAGAAEDFGETFDKGDVVGVCLNLDAEEKVEMKFTKNGTIVGSSVEIPKTDLEGRALFPHILTRNAKFQVNFGSTDPVYNSVDDGYVLVGKVEPSESRVRGPVRPASKEDCEMIMVIGLPACGKTKWSKEHLAKNPDKHYNILGTSTIVQRSIQDPTVITKNANRKFDGFFQKAGKFVEKLIEIAPSRRRHFILDQSNVVAGAQRRKSGGFKGFKRRAIVIIPSDEEYQKRIKAKEQEQGKSVPKSTIVSKILEMKATLRLPEVGEIFSEVEFPELDRTEGQKLVTQYNKEGVSAGYGKPIPSRGGGVRGRGRGNRGSGPPRGSGPYRGGWRGRGGGGPPRIPRGMPPMPLRGRGGPPPRGGPPSRIPRRLGSGHAGGMGSGGGSRGGGYGGSGSAIPTRASHQSSYQSRNSRGGGRGGGGSWQRGDGGVINRGRAYGPGGGGGGGGGGRSYQQQQYPHGGGMQNWGGPGNWGQQSNRGGGFGGGGGFHDPWQQHQQVPDQGFGQSWDSSGSGGGAMGGRNSGGSNMGNWNKGSGSTWYGYSGQPYGYGGGGRR